jgi:hypothetical protein
MKGNLSNVVNNNRPMITMNETIVDCNTALRYAFGSWHFSGIFSMYL